MELLLKCARTRIDDATAARIRELTGGAINWPGLRALACRHRVMPLLYRGLYETCLEQVPDEVLDQLRLEYHANAARSMELTESLLKILDLFEHQGIDVIPFKGPILTVVAYGDQALRLTGDLDLLVRVEDVPSADAVLRSEGLQPEYPLEGFEQNANLRGPGSCHFTGGKTNIDLHWEITPRTFTYDFNPDGYWSRLKPVSMSNKLITAFSMEDRLLMLYGHGMRNAWSQLVMICDVAETIPYVSQAEWRQVYESAESLGSEDVLYFGLSLAQELMNVGLPKDIQDQVRSESNNDFLIHQVMTRLMRESNEPLSGPGWLRFQLQTRQYAMDKVRFLWRLATTPNVDDLARKQLPSRLSFFYLLNRAVRLIGKYLLRPRAYKHQNYSI